MVSTWSDQDEYISQLRFSILETQSQRRDRGYTGQRMLNMELSGRRQRRRTEKIHGCNERGYGKGL